MDRPPWALPFLFVLVLLPAAVGLCFALVPIYRARKMRAVERMRLPTDACIACGARDLERVAPEVFRCQRCGFVGGEGMPALQRQLRLQKIEQLTHEQRRLFAIENLREARLALSSAETLLDDAASGSLVDMAGLSFDRGQAKQESFAAAARHISTAQALGMEAAEAIDLCASAPFE